MAVPHAELMRPAGMKPRSIAATKRASHCARRAGCSAAASPRATRRRTSATLASSPLAYFSRSTSTETSCASRVGAERISLSCMGYVPVQKMKFYACGASRALRALMRLGLLRALQNDGQLGVSHRMRHARIRRRGRVPLRLGEERAQGVYVAVMGRAFHQAVPGAGAHRLHEERIQPPAGSDPAIDLIGIAAPIVGMQRAQT